MARSRGLSIYLTFSYAVFLLVVAYGFARGFDYYFTPYIQRPHHPDYRILRPAGKWGLWYGIIGASMMIGMLSYSLRKRTRLLGKRGRLKTWLDIHILCGTVGPLLVILHTSFKLNGIVAVSFWSMVAVALSGVFGRYLYVQIPRKLTGDEFSEQELKGLLQDKLKPLENRLDEQSLNELLRLVTGADNPRSRWGYVIWSIGQDLTRGRRMRRVDKRLGDWHLAPGERASLLKAAREFGLLKRRVGAQHTIHRLFHHWHVFHRPFATIMYVVMLVHIGIAVAFGIDWNLF